VIQATSDREDSKIMTHSPIKTISMTLCIAAALATGNAQVQQKTDGNQEKQERALTKKKQKKQGKNRAKQAEKAFMNQLANGEPTAAQLAEYLKVNASRIGATIDHPSSLGVAVIRKLKTMPPEKLSKEVLPALEKQLMQMLS